MLSLRKQECDDLSSFFHKVERETVKETKFLSHFAILEKVQIKLAEENLAQQYELNLINNYIDKYLPVRIAHQMSGVLRPSFYNVTDFDEMYAKYEESETQMFEELH